MTIFSQRPFKFITVAQVTAYFAKSYPMSILYEVDVGLLYFTFPLQNSPQFQSAAEEEQKVIVDSDQKMEEKNSGDHAEVEEIERIGVVHNDLLKSPWPDVSYENYHDTASFAEQKVLPRPPKANRFLWCIALMIASTVILACLAVLIVYLSFHPRLPRLELTDAALKRVAIDRYTYIVKTEMTAFLKFKNPNERVDLRYEDVNLKLYFHDEIIATQVLHSFGQRRKKKTTDRWVIRMVSSNNTELTPLSALIMEQEILKKRTIPFKLFGKMKVIARLGRIKRIPYRLHLDCQLLFSAPPNAVLRHQSCTTSR